MFSICIIIFHVIKHICKICDENVSGKKARKKKEKKRKNNQEII